jgi:hypothetical protein
MEKRAMDFTHGAEMTKGWIPIQTHKEKPAYLSAAGKIA